MTDRTCVNPDTSTHPDEHLASDPAHGGHAPKRKSVWTTKQKLIRIIWSTIGRAIWVLIPSMRSSVLRLFGARVGSGCSFARDIDIVVPWNIRIGDRVSIADRSILYSLGVIDIGNDCVIDRKAHLCAGTHDMTDPMFPLLRPPITIGNGCFIGFDAYIGPEVVLGDRTCVYPRTSLYRSTEPGTTYRGNPAKLVEPAHEGQGS